MVSSIFLRLGRLERCAPSMGEATRDHKIFDCHCLHAIPSERGVPRSLQYKKVFLKKVFLKMV